MLRWAKRALHGLDDASVFVGILDDRPLDAARIEFILQVGHAVLEDKPIIIPIPLGVPIPKKLEAVADKVVRYNPDKLEGMAASVAQALTEMGLKPQ